MQENGGLENGGICLLPAALTRKHGGNINRLPFGTLNQEQWNKSKKNVNACVWKGQG